MKFYCLILFILIVSSHFFLATRAFEPIKPISFEFNDSKAREYWFYQIMTECKPERINSWDVPPQSTMYPTISVLHVFYNSTGKNIGYVAYNPLKNTLFMSFGGSHNIVNYLEDFDFLKMNFEKCDGCEVHEGFYYAYGNVKDEIIQSFVSLYSKYPNSNTAIIGHSLGAGMATFAFLDLYNRVIIDDFYTFGSPRIGNDKFAEYFNTNFNKTIKARIIHNRDAVPHIPFNWLGYAHYDQEIFYNEDSSKYVICNGNDDPNCSTQYSFIDTRPSDHTSYMGFDLGPWKTSCL